MKGYPAGTQSGTYVLTMIDGVASWETASTGVTDHTALSNLAWTSSGHTGTASKIAGFDGGGAAAEYAIGTDIQAYDAGLASIAGLSVSPDKMIYSTGTDTYALTTLTAYARTLLDDTTAAAAATTLALGTTDSVTFSDVTADYVTFSRQASTPGGSDFLYVDDGSNYTAGTLYWGNGSVFWGETSFGDPGYEQGGVVVNGTTYDAALKINDIGGSRLANLLVHKHSTTAEPVILVTRSNTDTSSHALVTSGQNLGRFAWAGHDGTDYVLAAEIDVYVDGTSGANDMPGRMVLSTTPDGGTTTSPALMLDSSQEATFYGNVNMATDADIIWSAGATRVYAASSNTDLYIEASDDVYIRPDDDVWIAAGTTSWCRYDGTTQRLGIGNTAPTYAIDVRDSVTTVMSRMENTNSGTSADVLALDFSAMGTAGSGNKWLDFLDSTGAAGWVNGNGAGGVNYGSSSDQRLKTDFQEPAPMLPIARAIKMWDYQWIASGQREVGPTAQGVQAVYPIAVQTPGDRNERRVVMHERRRASGKWESQPRALMTLAELDAAAADPDVRITSERPLIESDREYTYLGLDRSRLGILSLGALQELADLVDAQATTIAALEARIAALEAQ